MASIVDVRIKALERQIDTLKQAIAQPTGVFETLDKMIRNFRMANRETLRMLGFSAQRLGAQAQPGQALRRRLMLRRRIHIPMLRR